MKRASFIFYADWWNVIRTLSQSLQQRLFTAVCQYVFDGETDLDDDTEAKVAFLFIKQQLDRQQQQFEATCQQRSEAGKKGMESRWKKQRKNNKDNKCYNDITSDNKHSYNDNINENDNDNNILSIPNVIDNNNTSSDEDESTSPGEVDSPSRSEDGSVSLTPHRQRALEKKVLQLWNTLMADRPIACIQAISHTRRSLLAARLREYGEEGVETVVRKTSSSAFLNGLTNKDAKPRGFDWVFRPNNFIKVLEGNYDNPPYPTLPKVVATQASINVDAKQQETIEREQRYAQRRRNRVSYEDYIEDLKIKARKGDEQSIELLRIKKLDF